MRMEETWMEFFSIVMLTLSSVSGVWGGCRSGGPYGDSLCCVGKDLSCQTEGYRYINGRYELRDCYCDSACVENEDCCSDYDSSCPSVDCELSDWTYWSGCSVNCGMGVQERRRQRIKEPVNAGAKCGALREMRACFGSYCDENEIHGHSVAQILPHYYGERRRDPELNLMTAFLNIGLPEFDSYCVYFKVTNYHKRGCRSHGTNTWPASIHKGQIVCVQCEYPAYDDEGQCYGEGIEGKKSRWSAVDIPRCRGQWKQQYIYKQCTCRTGADFIFI